MSEKEVYYKYEIDILDGHTGDVVCRAKTDSIVIVRAIVTMALEDTDNAYGAIKIKILP